MTDRIWGEGESKWLSDFWLMDGVSLTELAVTAGTGRESEFSFERVVLEAHVWPPSVQI